MDANATAPSWVGGETATSPSIAGVSSYEPSTSLEHLWLRATSPWSEWQLLVLGSFLIHELVFFASGLPYLALDWVDLPWLRRYKIQTRGTTTAQQWKCVVRLFFYHVAVNLPLMAVSYPILAFFVIEDFVFYWGHRLLHTKWLYKHVHSVHHEWATPFGVTALYAHPVEILFLGLATVMGPALVGPHLLVMWTWMALRLIETVEAHCGYDFPWSPSRFLPLYGGADFHDYHHRLLYTKSGNYSSTFVYMDWLFGSDKGYRTLKRLQSTKTDIKQQ
eukprot:jgi/Chlat1/8138/Chrsp75S07600